MGSKHKNKKAKLKAAQDKAAIYFQKHNENVKAKQVAHRSADGFANFNARLGVGPDIDNRVSDGGYQFNFITRQRLMLEAAYRGSWIVGAMIDMRAEDMTRAGVEFKSSEASKHLDDFQNYIEDMGIFSSMLDGLKWGGLYGGAIGVLQIEGQDVATPLDLETIGKGQFQGVAIYDRWQVNPDVQDIIKSGPEMGLPKFYQIILGTVDTEDLADEKKAKDILKNVKGTVVHHSRVIRFIGHKLPYWQSLHEMSWGMSYIERMFDRLISFDTATLSTANLVNRAHLRTIFINNFRETLGTGGDAEEAMIKSFEYMRMFQQNEGVTLLDETDKFQSEQYTFSGLDGVLLSFGQQLSGASEIPLVRLFGQSPAGLNSTGESDLRNYYDGINSKQKRDLRKPLNKIFKVAWCSKFGKPQPNDFSYDFTSLWQITPKEEQEIAEANERTVQSAYDSGLISRSGAMLELKKTSEKTGVFSNITDEEIEAAKKEEAEEAPPLADIPNVEPDAEFLKTLEVKETTLAKLKKMFSGKK